jgi:toxin ParE1/3/4
MPKFELSNAADADFEDIFTFGIERFGLAQAMQYQSTLQIRFSEIAAAPTQFPIIDFVGKDYRRCVAGAHSIYFRQVAGGVLIVRILGRQNPETALA